MRAFRPTKQHPFLYGIRADTIADWVGCHITTARRWKRGEYPPPAAIQIIGLRSSGNLGLVNPAWSGWCLKDDDLISPNGDKFAPDDIMAGPYWRTLVRAYQTEQRLPRQADWVQGTWVPAVACE